MNRYPAGIIPIMMFTFTVTLPGQTAQPVQTWWELTDHINEMQQRGDLDGSERLVREWLASAEAARADPYPRAVAESFLASIDWDRGRFRSSTEHYENSLKIMNTSSNTPCEARLLVQSCLVSGYLADRRMSVAERWMREMDKTQNICSDVHKPTQARISMAHAAYAVAVGKAEEAEHWMEAALQEVNPAPADVWQRATAKSGLAMLYQRKKKFDRAEQLLREAESDVVTHCGPDHPALLRIRLNLGALLVERKRYAEALPLLQSSARIPQLTPDDLDASEAALSNLAVLYRKLGQKHEARRIEQQLAGMSASFADHQRIDVRALALHSH